MYLLKMALNFACLTLYNFFKTAKKQIFQFALLQQIVIVILCENSDIFFQSLFPFYCYGHNTNS